VTEDEIDYNLLLLENITEKFHEKIDNLEEKVNEAYERIKGKFPQYTYLCSCVFIVDKKKIRVSYHNTSPLYAELKIIRPEKIQETFLKVLYFKQENAYHLDTGEEYIKNTCSDKALYINHLGFTYTDEIMHNQVNVGNFLEPVLLELMELLASECYK
jgi:hypothetical protein